MFLCGPYYTTGAVKKFAEPTKIAGKRSSANKGVSTVPTDELDTLIFIFKTYYNFSL